MKIKLLIFSLFLAGGFKYWISAQEVKPLVYTPDEMEVLNELHGEYAHISAKILGTEKVQNQDGKIKSFASESSLKAMIPFIAACCALYFKGGLGHFLNNASLDSVADTYKDLDQKFRDYSVHENNESWSQLVSFLYGGWDKLGFGYAIAAYFWSGLLINILTGLASERTTTSLSTLDKLEHSVRRILSDEHKLDEEFREAVYDEFKTDFILLDKQVRPEFRQTTIECLERDYLLFYDKISKERETGSRVGVNFILGAMKLAIGVYALTWDKNCTQKSLIFALVAFFILNNFVLPSKDDEQKSEVLSNIYQIIKTAKIRNFEYVQQNAKIKEMEIKNNAVKSLDDKVSIVHPAAPVQVKRAMLPGLFGLLFRKKAPEPIIKKNEADEVKDEVEKVEKDLKLNNDIQQANKTAKKVLIGIGVTYATLICAVVGMTILADYCDSHSW